MFRLYAVRIFTYQWEEAVQFYRDTLGLEETFISEEFGWAQYRVGGAQFGVERCDPQDPETLTLVGRFVGASLEVDDIQSVYEDLSSRGVVFTEPPTRQPWGGILAHFEDPDGNVLTLLDSNSDNA